MLIAPALAVAPATAHAAPVRVSLPTTSLAPVAGRSVPPFAAWYDSLWSKIWTRIEQSLNSRTGVIQWGLLGMLLALWIIWWRK